MVPWFTHAEILSIVFSVFFCKAAFSSTVEVCLQTCLLRLPQNVGLEVLYYSIKVTEEPGLILTVVPPDPRTSESSASSWQTVKGRVEKAL